METGKDVIVEVVQQLTKDKTFNYTHLTLDLAMFAYFSNGRERFEKEWKKLFVNVTSTITT